MFLDRKYKNNVKIHKHLLSEAMSCILQIQGGSLAESLQRHQSLTGSRARKISAWKNTAERLQFIHTGAIRIFPVKLLSPGEYIWKIHMMLSGGGCWPAGVMPVEGHQAVVEHWLATPGLYNPEKSESPSLGYWERGFKPQPNPYKTIFTKP